MKIEHVAFPALDHVATAAWYVEHLEFRIVRHLGAPTYTHFLADASGSMIEIYNNPKVAVPDYTAMDPLLLHLAFVVEDVNATRQRLLGAGCSAVDEITPMPNGDILAMLRDPWGFAIQLVKRSQPMP